MPHVAGPTFRPRRILAVRLDPQLVSEVHDLAQERQQTLTELVEDVLSDHLRQQGRPAQTARIKNGVSHQG